jgi:hypothetical protein
MRVGVAVALNKIFDLVVRDAGGLQREAKVAWEHGAVP